MEIKSINMEQEETKTGGMFLNKPREVAKNVSLCSVARLLSGVTEMQIFPLVWENVCLT